jgi:hypothetical protein
VTFISDDVCSLTQTIPLEIIHEPIKKSVEPSLKTETEVSIKAEEKTEIKNEEKETKTKLDNQDKSPITDEQKPLTATSSLSTTDSENQDKKIANLPQIKTDLSPTEDEDVEELYLKENQKSPQPNTNLLHPHGSTLSLDKDKISIDSLDISNDRRNVPNNNHH